MTVPSRPSFLAIAGSVRETSNAFDVFVVLAQGIKALLDARDEDRKKTIQALEEARLKNRQQIEELFNRQQNTPSLTTEISRLWSSLTTTKNIAERAEKKANDALSLADKAFMIGRQANDLAQRTIQDIQFLTSRNVAALQRVEALIMNQLAAVRAETRAEVLRLWLQTDQITFRIGEIINRIVRIERITTNTNSQNLGNILSRLNIVEVAAKQLYQLNLEAMLKTEFNELHIDQANFRIDEVVGDLFNLTKLVNDAKATANSAIQKIDQASSNITTSITTTVNNYFSSSSFANNVSNTVNKAMSTTGILAILGTIQTSITDGNTRILNQIKTVEVEVIANNKRLATDIIPSTMQEALCQELQNGKCFPAGLNMWYQSSPLATVAQTAAIVPVTAQVTFLQGQVAALQGQVAALQTTALTTSTAVLAMKPIVVNTGSIVNTTNSNITKLGNQITNVTNVANNTNSQVTNLTKVTNVTNQNVTNLANPITNINNQVTNLTKVTNVTNQNVTNLANPITNINNQVTNLTQPITNLTNQVTNLTTVSNATNNQLTTLNYQVTNLTNVTNVTNQNVTNIANNTTSIAANFPPIAGQINAHNCVANIDVPLPYAGLGLYGLQAQIQQLSTQLQMVGQTACRTYRILGGNDWFQGEAVNYRFNPETSIKNSIKQAYREQSTSLVDTQPLTVQAKSLPQMLFGLDAATWRRSGLHKLPIEAPPSIMPNIVRNPTTGEIVSTRNWTKAEYQKITDNVSFQAYQLAQFQAVMGEFPLNITVEVEEGGKIVNKELRIDNISDGISELMGISLVIQDDLQLNTQLGMKGLIETAATKNAALITQDLALSNAKYLGYQMTRTPRQVKTLFTPGTQNIREFIKESDQQIISYAHKSGHLEHKLNTLLISAGITKAALTTQYKPGDMVMGGLIAKDALAKLKAQEDDWKLFLKLLREPVGDMKIDGVPLMEVEDLTDKLKQFLRGLQ